MGSNQLERGGEIDYPSLGRLGWETKRSEAVVGTKTWATHTLGPFVSVYVCGYKIIES